MKKAWTPAYIEEDDPSNNQRTDMPSTKGHNAWRVLWLSVIGQNFTDAAQDKLPKTVAPVLSTRNQLDRVRRRRERLDLKRWKRERQEQGDRTDALIWLRGGTEDFTTVCDLAGVDPDAIRRLALNAFGTEIDTIYPGATP